MKKKLDLLKLFAVPSVVTLGILVYFLLISLGQVFVANGVILLIVIVGSFDLVKESVQSLLAKKFALDYIALVAIVTGLITQEYIVSAVIVLMLSGGNTLEKYSMLLAKKALTSLTNRIPHDVQLWDNGKNHHSMKIEDVQVGQEILVRKGEVIPLDGVLQSEDALIDESSLTGEAVPLERTQGDYIKSATMNSGNPIVIKVEKADKDSTYRKIIQMVEKAQQEKSPLIRLADRYSTIFTIITFILAIIAYVFSHDPIRILAVLVMATPCPLILATPIALMGGMNLAAKKRIIVKRLSSIEVLARVKAIIFDKTGTITLGKPEVAEIFIQDLRDSRQEILAIAAAIERSSLHPLAKAIVEKAQEEKVKTLSVVHVKEKIGEGIQGEVNGICYKLKKPEKSQGMMIELSTEGKVLAVFQFIDHLKQDSQQVIQDLEAQGMELFIFTGDKEKKAKELLEKLDVHIHLKAECTPEDKQQGIAQLKHQGRVTAMVGDGINDAPALAAADVGIVFSNQEHTASTEASDIVLLGGNFNLVLEALQISQRTIHIAVESILVGIGLSILGMVLAAMGLIPPLTGAIFQEAIDVAVILNALRASR
jgi:heavy metal translocating P-type ATPase